MQSHPTARADTLTHQSHARGGRGCAETVGGAEEGQSIAHADRMHQRPRRAPTEAQMARGVGKDTHSPSRGRRRAGRDAGRAGGHRTRSRPHIGSQRAQERHTLPEVARGCHGHPHALDSPSDAPQATTGSTGAQIPTHRTKTSHSRTG